MTAIANGIKSNKSVGNFVAGLLDRIDKLGAIPGSFSMHRKNCPEFDSIKLFFGHEYVSEDDGQRIKLNLTRYLNRRPDDIATFYAALHRKRRNLPEENNDLLTGLQKIISSFSSECVCEVMQAYLQEESTKANSGNGELLAMAKKLDLASVSLHLAHLKRGFDALYSSDQPLRLSHFSLAVTGDTKSCRPGTRLLRQFADLLYRYDKRIKNEIDLSETSGVERLQHTVLDLTRLLIDSSATQILVFGDLVFSKQQQEFDYVSKHACRHETVVLTWAQLEGARIERTPTKLVAIENETSFYDYVEKADPQKEIVVCTMGQANRLLIHLLKSLTGDVKEYFHWGDLDRSGVLILDSMRRRTGFDIKPLHMNSAIYDKFKHLGQKLAENEKKLIISLLQKRPDIVCADLLRAIAESEVWIEQETLPQKS